MAPADTESVLSEGTQVGRYVVRATIGRGGMGTVVAADDPELNRSVALKVLNPSRRRSPTELARMLREAQSLARLSHPNIVAVYDVGTFEDGIFIAMELVVGQTIGEWIDEKNQRPWREVVEAFRQAGLGLAAVHEHGLVHRDFKPANVMIDDDQRVRVADFGLARLDDGFRSTSGIGGDLPEHLDSAGRFTETGTVMGTPAYMAPEQIRAGRGDARSDQFAYCVALYEALYGVNPFGREMGTKARLRRIAQRVYEPPVKQPGDPRRLRRALMRGLSYEPEERHQSMHHLLEEMARAVRPFPRGMLVGGTVLGLGAVAVAVAVAVAMDDGDPDEAVVCDATTAFEGAWDADKRAEIESAFRAAGVEY